MERGRKIVNRPRVGIVGASGLVGRTLLRVLAERRLPCRELRLFGLRAVGRELAFGARRLGVEAFEDARPSDLDLLFYAGPAALARERLAAFVEAGVLVIDKSSVHRLDPSVPLVVPELNAAALGQHAGLVATPNCTTIGVVLALAPLVALAEPDAIVVTTTQAISGVGREALEAFRAARGAAERRPGSVDGDVWTHCGALDAEGCSEEEHKLRDESRKILARPALALDATTLRVPVEVGHGASLWLRFPATLARGDVCAALERAPGVVLRTDAPGQAEVAGRDEVLVSRVRTRNAEGGSVVQLFCAVDNLRKGAATNAVQIAELLLSGPSSE